MLEENINIIIISRYKDINNKLGITRQNIIKSENSNIIKTKPIKKTPKKPPIPIKKCKIFHSKQYLINFYHLR